MNLEVGFTRFFLTAGREGWCRHLLLFRYWSLHIRLCGLNLSDHYWLQSWTVKNKEKIIPHPPKAMMKARSRAKTRHFRIIEMGGRVVQMIHLFCPRLWVGAAGCNNNNNNNNNSVLLPTINP